jgi:hypothetical protein
MLKRLIQVASLTAFGCILVIFGMAVYSADEAQKSVQKNQQADYRTSLSNPNVHLSEPSSFLVNLLVPGGLKQITAYCNSYSEEEKKKWPQNYYCDVKFTDVWIAVFSGLLAFVTVGLFRIGSRQTKDARITQRAFVYLSQIRPFPDTYIQTPCARDTSHLEKWRHHVGKKFGRQKQLGHLWPRFAEGF